MSEASRPRRHALARRRAVLVLASIMAAFLVAELGVRIATGRLLQGESPDNRRGFSTPDPVLGSIPRSGLSGRLPGGASIHLGEHGTRSNGPEAARAERPLTVVTGDSFAFGDQVDDADTWPAVLERALGTRVVNGGVPGYGLDQAVLRAEQLAAVYAPETLVVGFIPHDVVRCEMSFWSGHAKPWFELEGAGLRYRPAPEVHSLAGTWVASLLSRSVLLDRAFSVKLHWDGPDTFAHHDGREVACRLMDRLARFGREHHTRVIVLAQPQQATPTPEQTELAAAAVACAARGQLEALDLHPVQAALGLAEREALYHRHMTARGNRLVGEHLARLLANLPRP